ncbi:MAG TPA: MaoC family dehydratase [Cytophagales bacterium]
MENQKSSSDFNKEDFVLVAPRTFKDLKVGEIFRAPSRTVTDAHASAFQAVSCDNHPMHYDKEYALRHGHPAPVVHGLQVVAFTAPGATLFSHYVGEVFIAISSVCYEFLKEVHAGDTLYAALEITDLIDNGATGTVVAGVTVHNQNSELVLKGEQRGVLKN